MGRKQMPTTNHDTIFQEEYWKERMECAGEEHHAVFICHPNQWRKIANRHRELLERMIKPSDSVLEVGCGWGRLLDLMPQEWKANGHYVGVDLSPDFIAKAQERYPTFHFMQLDMRNMDSHFHPPGDVIQFDWAIAVSIRPMIIRHRGQEEWDQIQDKIKRYAKKILFLEYDPNDTGDIIEFPQP